MNTIKILFLLLLLPFCTYGQTHTNDDWKTINQLNYSLKYPKNWELDESGVMGTKLILFSPLESSSDTFKENVNLFVQDLAGYNLDLDAFSAMSKDQIKTMIENSKIIESEKISTASHPYYKMIYTGDQGILHLKFEQYYFVINDIAYVLTLTTEQNNFDNYKAIGEKILSTFEVK